MPNVKGEFVAKSWPDIAHVRSRCAVWRLGGGLHTWLSVPSPTDLPLQLSFITRGERRAGIGTGINSSAAICPGGVLPGLRSQNAESWRSNLEVDDGPAKAFPTSRSDKGRFDTAIAGILEPVSLKIVG
jgi:hypothetical protein